MLGNGRLAASLQSLLIALATDRIVGHRLRTTEHQLPERTRRPALLWQAHEILPAVGGIGVFAERPAVAHKMASRLSCMAHGGIAEDGWRFCGLHALFQIVIVDALLAAQHVPLVEAALVAAAIAEPEHAGVVRIYPHRSECLRNVLSLKKTHIRTYPRTCRTPRTQMLCGVPRA